MKLIFKNSNGRSELEFKFIEYNYFKNDLIKYYDAFILESLDGGEIICYKKIREEKISVMYKED